MNPERLILLLGFAFGIFEFFLLFASLFISAKFNEQIKTCARVHANSGIEQQRCVQGLEKGEPL